MEKGVILYPCYFDSDLRRSEGRRVSQGSGASHPEPMDIERILKANQIPFNRESKSHPSFWWKHQGRFIVDYSGPKSVLINLIGNALKGSGKKT